MIGAEDDGAGQPPRALIVTVFGLYARDAGGWLSVAALIKLLAALDVDAPAVRSTVSRLKRRGILTSERRAHGGAGYALSTYARDLLDRGDRRIFVPPVAADDGWVLAVFSVPETERHQRYALRNQLAGLGFGMVSPGVWIAPAHLLEETRHLLHREGLTAYVDLFAAHYLAFGDPAEQAARWWDLDGLDGLYRAFTAAHRPILERWRSSAGAPDVEAFADYVRALTAWRRLPYRDPGLPAALLPPTWGGTAAAEVFFGLRDLLTDPARRFAMTHES